MRPHESVSSIEMFLKCPHAYELKYVKGYQTDAPQRTAVGKWVHSQLEKWANGEETSPYAHQFIKAASRVVKPSEIIRAEKAFLYDFHGIKLKGFIDVTCADFISDWKVTASPKFYTNKSGFQPAIYRMIEEKPFRYYLIEYDWKKRVVKDIHDIPVIYTDLLQIQRINELASAIDMIRACWSIGAFPPNWQNCHMCFMKNACSENY